MAASFMSDGQVRLPFQIGSMAPMITAYLACLLYYSAWGNLAPTLGPCTYGDKSGYWVYGLVQGVLDPQIAALLRLFIP